MAALRKIERSHLYDDVDYLATNNIIVSWNSAIVLALCSTHTGIVFGTIIS